MNDQLCGAAIERGVIETAEADGYTVKSIDRKGIISPIIRAIDGAAYQPGDLVCFFLFRDGTGKILCNA